MFYVVSRQGIEPSWFGSDEGVEAVSCAANRQVCIPILDENMIVLGTSGYGKTTFTKKYVSQLLQKNKDAYAVFFQIKKDDFTKEFLRQQDRVITISEDSDFGDNLFKWNMVKEIRSVAKSERELVLEHLASILFADLMEDSRNRIWAAAAKSTFQAFIRVIICKYSNNPSNAELIGAIQSMPKKKLLQFLAEYPPNRSMLRDNFDYDPGHPEGYVMPRKGNDIFFFLQNITERFSGVFLSENGEDTIYDYLHGNYGERLFIIHDHKNRHSCEPFERFFLKYICDEKLSLTSSFPGKMILVLDEVDKVGYDFGLTQAVTLGRGFNLQIILSTQSLESLYAIAPEHYGNHLTNASLAGYAATVAFHPGDTHTIETLQTLYGKRRKQTIAFPLSRYDRPTVTTEIRPFVEDSDFASLGVGECYIKIKSDVPARVKIIL